MIIEPSGFRTDWAGRSSKKVMPVHDDYARFGSFIGTNAKGAHHEAGDPDRAAEIIYDQVTHHADDLPLRLPLGDFAAVTAIDKYRSTLQDFERLHELSASADRPEA